MTCSDVERLLPEILDDTPNSEFQIDFDNHLKSCRDCSDLISDLKLITNEAQYLVATEEPSSRVWEGISAQLKVEGLIREPRSSRRSKLVPALLGHRWGAWLVAPVAAALIAASSYIVIHKPAPQLAQQPAPAIQPAASSTTPAVATETSASDNTVASSSANNSSETKAPRSTTAQQPDQKADVAKAAVESAPSPSVPSSSSSSSSSSEDEQFLTAVSTNAPSMRATYENQLQAVNADIRETQAYVDHNPGDIDARQHLMDAYQQKALL